MTAVASPPTFPQLSRPAWGAVNGNPPMNPDVRSIFAHRTSLPRSNSSSSISSSSSNVSNGSHTSVATNGSQSNGTSVSTTSDLSQWSTTSSIQRKRPQQKASWPSGKGETLPDFSRLTAPRLNGMNPQAQIRPGPGQQHTPSQQMMRPNGPEQFPSGQPVLYLLSLNGTFERKTIAVPFAPESLRIGRQTNQKTIPTPTNGFFDSKVLSRQHAEIYAERNGKIYIRDVKSSNGTFVNGTRLSQENRESEPHELQTADQLELGIDIVSEDQKTVVHHKVAAKVEHAGFMSSSNNVMDMNFGDLDPANGAMLMPGGALMRGRQGSNAPIGSNGRVMHNGGMNGQMNGMPQQRPYLLAPIATDQILKKITVSFPGVVFCAPTNVNRMKCAAHDSKLKISIERTSSSIHFCQRTTLRILKAQMGSNPSTWSMDMEPSFGQNIKQGFQIRPHRLRKHRCPRSRIYQHSRGPQQNEPSLARPTLHLSGRTTRVRYYS